MPDQTQPTDKQIAEGWSVLVMLGLFLVFLVWLFFPESDERKRQREIESAAKRQELHEWGEKRREEAAMRRRNEIIYEELLRQSVRP